MVNLLGERFVKHITVGETGCWIWTGCLRGGYGTVMWRGKNRFTHIVAYEKLIGPVPKGLELDHTCRDRRCCFIKHLEPVTHAINVLRGEGLAAQNARKTECINGHPFDEQNTIIIVQERHNNRPSRECRVCKNQRNRDYKERQRAKRAGLTICQP